MDILGSKALEFSFILTKNSNNDFDPLLISFHPYNMLQEQQDDFEFWQNYCNVTSIWAITARFWMNELQFYLTRIIHINNIT